MEHKKEKARLEKEHVGDGRHNDELYTNNQKVTDITRLLSPSEQNAPDRLANQILKYCEGKENEKQEKDISETKLKEEDLKNKRTLHKIISEHKLEVEEEKTRERKEEPNKRMKKYWAKKKAKKEGKGLLNYRGPR